MCGQSDCGDSRSANQFRMGMARDRNFNCNFGLGIGAVEITRITIILIMGLMAFAVRAGPQLFFVGRKFPEAWDRLLRYLSYAFICSIISVTLFMAGARFETQVAPYRGAALAVTIIIAHKTKSAVTGMLVGMVLALLFSWIREPPVTGLRSRTALIRLP